MAIGNDDFDDIDEFEEEINNEDTLTQDDIDEEEEIQSEAPVEEKSTEESWINSLLKEKGIIDPSKIKFENEEGDLEEHSWDSLSDSDKLEILRSSDNSDDAGLDDSEIELINTIRNSKMSPAEYINYIQQQGVDNYLANTTQPFYQVDEIDDDTLFVTDILARVGEDNITDEELQSMLDTAKTNEALFKKQVQAIRNEYKTLEDNNRNQEAELARTQQIETYNKFAESVEDEIRNFTEFGGFDLNMDESEMEELYNFITGFDEAGVSVFGKALNDPQLLVRMAWYALNGERAIQDINDYWTNELKNTRRSNSKQMNKKNDVQIVKKEIKQSNDYFDDLDDDF